MTRRHTDMTKKSCSPVETAFFSFLHYMMPDLIPTGTGQFSVAGIDSSEFLSERVAFLECAEFMSLSSWR